MKNLFALMALLFAHNSFAATQEIICQKVPGKTPGAALVTLQKVNTSNASTRYYINGAHWGFHYSTAQLTCSKTSIDIAKDESFDCVGYVSAGGKIEIAIRMENGEGTAKVHNIGYNIYSSKTNGMELPCQIRDSYN